MQCNAGLELGLSVVFKVLRLGRIAVCEATSVSAENTRRPVDMAVSRMGQGLISGLDILRHECGYCLGLQNPAYLFSVVLGANFQQVVPQPHQIVLGTSWCTGRST